MSSITQAEFTLLSGFYVLAVTMLVWTVLWSRRSASVHLWCGAGICGAAFQALLVLQASSALLPRVLEFPLLAALGTGSLLLKVFALDRLDHPPRWRLRTPAVALALAAAIALAFALSPASRAGFSVFLLGVMQLCAHAASVLAARVARRQRVWTAGALAVTLAIPLVTGFFLYVSQILAGQDMLAFPPNPVGLVMVPLSALFLLCNNGLYIGIVMELTARQESAASVEVTRLQQQRARLEERARLMADLHDGFGTQLTSARLSAEQGQLTPATMAQVLQECIADLHLVVDTVDNVEGDIGDALRYLRHRLQGRLEGSPIALHWDVHTAEAPALPPARLLQVLRILQEAINNALRHSGAGNVQVSAEWDGGRHELRCRVLDDGRGFSRDATEGAGLRNMRGRAQRLGAQLLIEDASPGTRVEIVLPLGPAEDAAVAGAEGNGPVRSLA